MAKPLTSWLVLSFSQHNLRLVVSERCLHVSVTKFWHKFTSLRQVNTPSSWEKFQNCCTDMYLIRFLPNFAVFCVFLWISPDFADLPEFRGSATARNIRSPDTSSWGILWLTKGSLLILTFHIIRSSYFSYSSPMNFLEIQGKFPCCCPQEDIVTVMCVAFPNRT